MPSHTLFLNSENATTSSTNGDEFMIRFNQPIEIPRDAKNTKIYLHSANIWYAFPNITIAGGNADFYITDDAANATKYNIVLDDGLYSLSDLSTEIDRLLLADHAISSGTLTLSGDYSTGKVIVNLATGYQVNFASDTMYELLGATSGQLVPSGGLTTGTYTEKLPNVATFSSLANILLHCSLSNSGVYNTSTSTVLGSIPITSEPGYEIVYQPYNLLKLNADHLRGSSINEITCFITDDDGSTRLNTNNEDWNCVICIEWD